MPARQSTAEKTRTAAAHVLRPAAPAGQRGKRSAARAAAAATQYPPGYFTALCREHGWPYPGWQPIGMTAEEERFARYSKWGALNSRAAVEAGQLTSISLLGSLDSAPDLVAKLRNWRKT